MNVSLLRLPTIVFLWLLLVINCTHCTLINVTIDDEFGDIDTRTKPSYNPSDGWTQGANCPGCKAQPNKSFAIDQTWHDATHHPEDPNPERSIDLTFRGKLHCYIAWQAHTEMPETRTGQAIYVYFILANTIGPQITSDTHLNFILDGEAVGQFDHTASTSTDYLFNQTVYANDSIPDGNHTLSISSSGNTPASLLLFDYAVYT